MSNNTGFMNLPIETAAAFPSRTVAAFPLTSAAEPSLDPLSVNDPWASAVAVRPVQQQHQTQVPFWKQYSELCSFNMSLHAGTRKILAQQPPMHQRSVWADLFKTELAELSSSNAFRPAHQETGVALTPAPWRSGPSDRRIENVRGFFQLFF